MSHIAIAGAGIMGRTLAWWSLNQGHRVTLLETAGRGSDPGGNGASWTAAGMLTPNTEVDVSPELLAMGRASLALWPAFADALGLAHEFNRGGCWVVAHPQDREQLLHFQRRLARLELREGQSYRSLSASALAAELAPLSRFGGALYFPEEASIPPRRVLERLERDLRRADCDWRGDTTVLALGARHIDTDHGTVYADATVDCRGLGAREQLTTLRGVRGELVEVRAPAVDLPALVRLMHPRYALYIVPRPRQHFVIGATQIESDDTGPISVRSALELLSAAYSVHPGFAEARIVATRAHCRPALPDNHPRIGRHPGGAWYINGLYRHGILLAPLLAREALRQLELTTTREESDTP
ncbi:FAD-dependent oxidoreductase [Parahaliea mediterranea]|uniref:FAD-dependent oxidoreductase n=1 Tax=Parahaliea mediterranea TaxID=651086 RepID=A0A939DIN4_9GAMM|nr:FAD-dependent oxidoreductase [Parahaliea mediterranea]